MRPRTITMEGFGAFRARTVVDLTDGDLVALTGPTGSGKSTIIDALTFALYGTVARYDNERLVAPIINQMSSVAKVQLDFELHGEIYRATRVVRRTKTGATTPEARLERGDEVLADQAGPMTARVGELLGLDAAQFNKTVVLPQGRFAEFLHDKPSERQAMLRRLLDLGLYERLGKTARSRAGTARAQADGFETDVAAQTEALSDERRAELDARLIQIAEVTDQLVAAGRELDRLTTERTTLDTELTERSNQVEALAAIVLPAGLTEAAAERERVGIAAADAATALIAARVAQRDAATAVASGPNLAISLMQHATHERSRGVVDRLASLRAAGDEIRRRVEAAMAARLAADTRLAQLDDVVEQTEVSLRVAVEALDGAGDEVELRGWRAAHDRLTTGRPRHEQSIADLAAADAVVDAAERSMTAAIELEHTARERLRADEQHAGATALVAALRPGDPCPVCQQVVHVLPDAPPDHDLAAAREAVETTSADVGTARRHAEQARAQQATAREAVRLRAESLIDDETLVADAPDLTAITAALTDIADGRATVAAARTALDTARHERAEADRHPDTVAARAALGTAERESLTHDAAVAAAEQQRSACAAELDGVPPADVVDAALATATALAEARTRADAAVAEAERVDAEARQRVAAVERRLSSGRAELSAARDRVVGLAPPVLDHDDIAGSWSMLHEWAHTRATIVATERADLTARRDAVLAEAEALVTSVRAAVTAVAPGASGDRAALREAVVRAEAEARAARDTFDARRAELTSLRARIATLRDAGAVADALGRLLSVTGFESWLMESALVALSERATERLRELSGGRFSLVVDDREFLVRDHHHADELRSVRTLSGGETFLASLALALALAEATAELAPGGASTIESIFLDEGFGTLDPETMDTVAAAIEELGASGRMVVLVTHVRDLADRMPVRIEVRRGPETATVERIDT